MDAVKDEIINKLKGDKLKQVAGFKITEFKVKLENLKNVKKNKNVFNYLNELLDYIIDINNKYLEYFKEYEINTEHNINEIYNLTNQLLGRS